MDEAVSAAAQLSDLQKKIGQLMDNAQTAEEEVTTYDLEIAEVLAIAPRQSDSASGTAQSPAAFSQLGQKMAQF